MKKSCKAVTCLWFFNTRHQMGDYHYFSRNHAITSAQIDPLDAALGFPGYSLTKQAFKPPMTTKGTYRGHDRVKNTKYSLTSREKAFLIRRLATG